MAFKRLKRIILVLGLVGLNGCMAETNVSKAPVEQEPRNQHSAGGDPSEAVATAARKTREVRQEVKEPAYLIFGQLHVNENRFLTLPTELPVWTSCSLTNTHPTSRVDLSSLSTMKPVVQDTDMKELTVDWEQLGPFPNAINPNATVHIHWLLKTPLKAGQYHFEIRPQAAQLKADFTIRAIRIGTATLEISEKPADPQWASHFHRKIQFLRGEYDAVVKSLTAELAKHPEYHHLRAELADAYEEQGDLEAAENQLRNLAFEIQKKNQADGKGKVTNIPVWINYRLESIRSRREQEKPKPPERN